MSPHHHAAAAAHAHAASLQHQQQHNIYLQHQQYQQQLQHQHQRRSVASQPLSEGQSKSSNRENTNEEPETITLSDDDEVHHSTKALSSEKDDQTTKDKNKTGEEDKQCATALEKEKLAESLATGVKPSQSTLSREDFLSQNSSNENVDKCKEELESGRTGQEYGYGRNSQSPNGIVNPAKIKTERLSDIPLSMNGSNIGDLISSKPSVLRGELQCEMDSTDNNYRYYQETRTETDEDLDLHAQYQNSMKKEADPIRLSSFSIDELSLQNKETSDLNFICAMTMLQFSKSGFEADTLFGHESRDVSINSNGLDILIAGIEIRTFEEILELRNATIGVDMLCSITRQDCYRFGIGESCCYNVGIEELCNVTTQDYLQFVYWIDPIVVLKHQFRIRDYQNEARAMLCRNFIADRISAKKEEESFLTLDQNFKYPNSKIKSLDHVIRKIKNTEIMSQLEVSLREQICDLQNIYSEKQKEVSRLKLTPKKVKKLRTKRQRGPGRPKKRMLKSTKSKMGRPRKTRGSCESNEMLNDDKIEQLSDNATMDEDVDIVKMMDEPHSLLPPVLEPFKNSSTKSKNSRKSTDSPPPPPLTPMMDSFGNMGSNISSNTNGHLISNLLRPPRLTANSSPVQLDKGKTILARNRSSVTNLSTINEKFMKGKANPFANLLTKLATKPSNAQNESDEKDEDESSQSDDAEDDDKHKLSLTDGDETEKEENNDMESTTTEEDEGIPSHKQNNKRSILETSGKTFSSSAKSSPGRKNILKSLDCKTNLDGKDTGKRINEKRNISSQEQQDIATGHSSEQNVSSDFEDNYNNSTQKKRKSDKPKKHFGGTNEVETIVPKKPKNLFMMNCLKIQQNQREVSSPSGNTNKAMLKKDEYDFTDDDEDHEIIKIGKHRKHDTAPAIVANTSTPSPVSSPSSVVTSDIPSAAKSNNPPSRARASTATTSLQQSLQQPPEATSSPKKERHLSGKHPSRPKSAASNSSFGSSRNPILSSDESSTAGSPMKAPRSQALSKKSLREKKKLVVDSEPKKRTNATPNTHNCPDPSRTAALQENDLKDGLKILTLQEGRFWPARINSTPLPDIFGVVVEGQRRNVENIMARDDILNQAILDLKPHCRKQLPVGTRVCVYWSNATGNCLFPGTIDTLDEDIWPETSGMVQVTLDDGDERQVELSKVRLLPPNYQHVEYDPDPISSLRRRRVSADSADSDRSIDPHSKRRDNIAPLAVISETTCTTVSPVKTTTTSSGNLQTPTGKRNGVNGTANKNDITKAPSDDEINDIKRHKKRKKHHHCKHKHRKLSIKQKANRKQTPGEEAGDEESADDDSDKEEEDNDQNLRVKLDGSFNNTTTYSIRSPIYPSGTRACSEGGSNPEDEKERDGDDELDGESDENDEEVDEDEDASEEDDDSQKSSRKHVSKSGRFCVFNYQF